MIKTDETERILNKETNRTLLISDEEGNVIATIAAFDEIDLKGYMEAIEGEIFRHAWEKYRSSTKIARALSITQPTAYRKIRKYCNLTEV